MYVYKGILLQVHYQAFGQDRQYAVHNVPLDMSLVTNNQPIQFSLDNLTSNTSYIISVSAATQHDNSFLEGPLSVSIIIKTVETGTLCT